MALCIECRANKTFERGAKRCSDCQAAYDAAAPRTDATDTATSRDAVADAISPGSLLMIGIVSSPGTSSDSVHATAHVDDPRHGRPGEVVGLGGVDPLRKSLKISPPRATRKPRGDRRRSWWVGGPGNARQSSGTATHAVW